VDADEAVNDIKGREIRTYYSTCAACAAGHPSLVKRALTI
jgi:hypothetical protein